MASKNDLPEIVETDGEVSVPMTNINPALLISAAPVSKSRNIDDIARLQSGQEQHSKINQKLDNYSETERLESGYGSYLSQSSLSNTGSLSPGLSAKLEEKKPVQCSGCDEENSKEEAGSLTSKLSNLTIVEEADEGVILSVDQSDDVLNENFSLEAAFTERDGDGDTIIHTAILSEMISVVFALIELCPSLKCLNAQNELFQTPLHLAVLTNLSEIVRKLVAKGADVLMRDQQGNTALHIACRTGDKDSIETIVESVKDTNRLHKLFAMKNSEGLTCLHIAAEKKHYKIMGYLFAKGADVNMGDAKSGRTILHHAVERRDRETVKSLLTHKDIDIDCATYKGESALVIAYWRNYQEIVKDLRKNGAYFSFDLVDVWDEEETTS